MSTATHNARTHAQREAERAERHAKQAREEQAMQAAADERERAEQAKREQRREKVEPRPPAELQESRPASAATSRVPSAAASRVPSAAAAPRGNVAPPPPAAPLQGATPEVAALAAWIGVANRIKPGAWVRVVEAVLPTDPLTGADVAGAPVAHRLISVQVDGTAAYAKQSGQVVKAAHYAAAVEQLRELDLPREHRTSQWTAVEEASLRKDANDMLARRAFDLRQFTTCTAILETTDDVFAYGKFPLLAGELLPDRTLRHVGYSSLVVVPADDMPKLQQLCAAYASSVPLMPSSSGANRGDAMRAMWTTSSDVGEQAVASIIEDFGTSLRLYQRVPDGALRVSFAQLAASIMQGYHCADADGKRRMALRLLALPRMHCRDLVARASGAVRNKFLQQQLSGLVCTEAEREGGRRERATPTEQQHVASCVAKAFKRVQLQQIGRAGAALTRPMPVEIDAEKKVADLRLLHPKGEPAKDVTLPAAPLHSAATITIEDLRAGVHAACNGSAPGPDGWTFEMVLDALGNDLFAREFRAFIVDVCNGAVHDDVKDVLAASSLVGIPKGKTAADGTRPIALGSTFLKIASARALASVAKPLAKHFAGVQFGCNTKGGAEYIVHETRAYLRDRTRPAGRVVLTFDASNAFNTPTRQAMWDEVKKFPELAGVFLVSYGRASKLYVVGTNVVIMSERGARQGTIDGPVDFGLTIHPAIVALNKIPGCRALGYLDDITALCDTLEAALAAQKLLAEYFAGYGIALNAKKCEFFAADPGVLPPADSPLAQFRGGTAASALKAIKLLGASIARTDDAESEHLFDREMAKAKVYLDRLARSPSPQFFMLLRMCVITKVAYALRVHTAYVSRRLAEHCDAGVEELLAKWASVPSFSNRQRLLIGMPRALGGLGLTRAALVAPAAYHASLSFARSRSAGDGSMRVVSQAAICQELYRRVLESNAADTDLMQHLHAHALDGADAALCCTASSVHPDVFGALLRTVLMADAGVAAEGAGARQCPGCKRDFATGGAWGEHVSSCAIAQGGYVTRRHNSVVALLRRYLAEAGFTPDATEPRDLALYDCPCRPSHPFSHEEFKAHRECCAEASSKRLRLHGPDILYNAFGYRVAADFTVGNPLVATHMQNAKTALEMLAQKSAIKIKAYGALCKAAGVKLLPLPATSQGHLGPELTRLCNAVADHTFRDRRALRALVSATIAHGSAVARLSAEQRLGVRPATQDSEVLRVLNSFVIAPAVVVADASDLPPLLPEPAAAATPGAAPAPQQPPASPSLEQRIAAGAAAAFAEFVPTIVDAVVAAAALAQQKSAAERKAAEEAERRRAARRAERELQRARDGRPRTWHGEEAGSSADDDDVVAQTSEAAHPSVAAPAPVAAPRASTRTPTRLVADPQAAQLAATVETRARIDMIRAASQSHIAAMRDQTTDVISRLAATHGAAEDASAAAQREMTITARSVERTADDVAAVTEALRECAVEEVEAARECEAAVAAAVNEQTARIRELEQETQASANILTEARARSVAADSDLAAAQAEIGEYEEENRVMLDAAQRRAAAAAAEAKAAERAFEERCARARAVARECESMTRASASAAARQSSAAAQRSVGRSYSVAGASPMPTLPDTASLRSAASSSSMRTYSQCASTSRPSAARGSMPPLRANSASASPFPTAPTPSGVTFASSENFLGEHQPTTYACAADSGDDLTYTNLPGQTFYPSTSARNSVHGAPSSIASTASVRSAYSSSPAPLPPAPVRGSARRD